VQTARDLNLTGSAVSLQGQANLHIVGSAADPVIRKNHFLYRLIVSQIFAQRGFARKVLNNLCVR